MPWLYEHQGQLDEQLALFAGIAYHLTAPIPPCDMDDVEQEIVITLMQVADRRGNVSEDYLWGVARNVVKGYWRKRYRQRRKFLNLREGSKGEVVAKTWQVVSGGDRDEEWTLICDGDKDARLDAMATLAKLPERLKEIGYKRLNGETLSRAERYYWSEHKAKLDCRKRGRALSDWERRRIAQLYHEGVPIFKIARTLGRSRIAVDLCLVQAGLKEAPPSMLKGYGNHHFNLPEPAKSPCGTGSRS